MKNLTIGDSRVLESRESADGMSIRRRREAADGRRFTTYERIERRNIVIAKRDDAREPFDRSKLANSIHKSVAKFFKSEMEVDALIDDIEDAIYELGENEISSKTIGEIVLDKLAKENDVAYVRFASVFYDFRTLNDFVQILDRKQKEKGE